MVPNSVIIRVNFEHFHQVQKKGVYRQSIVLNPAPQSLYFPAEFSIQRPLA